MLAVTAEDLASLIFDYRFPEDFMFQLTKEEFDNLMFQFGTSNRGGTRKLPYAFTEQGFAILEFRKGDLIYFSFRPFRICMWFFFTMPVPEIEIHRLIFNQ